MAVTSAQVSVGTTATLLTSTTDTDANPGNEIIVANPVGGTDTYLGGPGVTTGTGLLLTGGSSIALQVNPGDALYGVVAASTNTLHVLRNGV